MLPDLEKSGRRASPSAYDDVSVKKRHNDVSVWNEVYLNPTSTLKSFSAFFWVVFGRKICVNYCFSMVAFLPKRFVIPTAYVFLLYLCGDVLYLGHTLQP